MQQHVNDELAGTESDLYQFSSKSEEPEAAVHTTESPLTDKADLARDLDNGEVQPIRTAEQRRYSIDWDPLQ